MIPYSQKITSLKSMLDNPLLAPYVEDVLKSFEKIGSLKQPTKPPRKFLKRKRPTLSRKNAVRLESFNPIGKSNF